MTKRRNEHAHMKEGRSLPFFSLHRLLFSSLWSAASRGRARGRWGGSRGGRWHGRRELETQASEQSKRIEDQLSPERRRDLEVNEDSDVAEKQLFG